MTLTRFGFNALAAIYLIPLLIIDIVGNAMTTGSQSDQFFYKCLFDGLLLAYAIYTTTRPATATVSTARAKKDDHRDEVVSFENLGTIEWVYCLILAMYAIFNFISLHALNKEAQGLMALCTLIWSFLSLAVCVLALIQFYRIKSGSLVELKSRIIQQ
jgi:hypothetical protein